jgi:hypothetical protein
MNKLFALTALLITSTSMAAEPSQYLCTAEAAAGLHYDKQTDGWRGQAFNTATKYLLRKLNDTDRDEQRGKWWALLEKHSEANWAFFEFGESNPPPLATCFEDINGILPSRFRCRDVIMHVAFDKESRRFELLHHGAFISQGYWSQKRRDDGETHTGRVERDQAGNPSAPDDLFVKIGHCESDF